MEILDLTKISIKDEEHFNRLIESHLNDGRKINRVLITQKQKNLIEETLRTDEIRPDAVEVELYESEFSKIELVVK